MVDPIRYFLEKDGFFIESVKDFVIGDKYVGIMLNDGKIGICATLGNEINPGLLEGEDPNPDFSSHRIILNAWYNAIHNYQRDYEDIVDIFDRIDFRKYRRIIMVGYFESLYLKFQNSNINVEVFDIQKKSEILSDIRLMEESLAGAEAVIVSGTTIFNNTFTKVISSTPPKSKVFLLGPSNILSSDMFNYPNVSIIFGSVFEIGDLRVLSRIAEGHGTPGLLPYLNKVYIMSETFQNEI